MILFLLFQSLVFSSSCFILTGTWTAGRSTLLARRRPFSISVFVRRASGGSGCSSGNVGRFLASSGVRRVPPEKIFINFFCTQFFLHKFSNYKTMHAINFSIILFIWFLNSKIFKAKKSKKNPNFETEHCKKTKQHKKNIQKFSAVSNSKLKKLQTYKKRCLNGFLSEIKVLL